MKSPLKTNREQTFKLRVATKSDAIYEHKSHQDKNYNDKLRASVDEPEAHPFY